MLVVTCGVGQVAGSASASSPPCLRGPAVGAGLARRSRQLHHPVATQPAEQLYGQIRQLPGQPGHVVPGIEHDQDGRVAVPPVPGLDQPGHDVADLRGGDLGLVVIRPQPDRVQDRGPAGAARLQRSDDRVRPARDHLRAALAPAVDVAEQPAALVAASGRSHGLTSTRQPDPAVRPGRQRQSRQRPAQPGDLDPAAVHRVVRGAMTTPVLRHQRQARQVLHRPVRAQHRISQLEQRIRPGGQAGVELAPEA